MKGVYVLIIEVKENIRQKIGKLGNISFKKGRYAYVGSAQNNVEKRITRHFSRNKKKHWHIDYLLTNKDVKIDKAFWKEANKAEECKIASLLLKLEEPIKGFGCSDCKCSSHLFRLKTPKNINKLNMTIFK